METKLEVGMRVRVPADWYTSEPYAKRLAGDAREATVTSADETYVEFLHVNGNRSKCGARANHPIEVLSAPATPEVARVLREPQVGDVWSTTPVSEFYEWRLRELTGDAWQTDHRDLPDGEFEKGGIQFKVEWFTRGTMTFVRGPATAAAALASCGCVVSPADIHWCPKAGGAPPAAVPVAREAKSALRDVVIRTKRMKETGELGRSIAALSLPSPKPEPFVCSVTDEDCLGVPVKP